MDWSKVADVVGGAAPIVGTIFGGPVGAAAGGIISGICSLFGADPKDPADLLAKIQADPDAVLKLREFELRNKVELEKVALESDRMHLQDISDARSREVAGIQATGKRDAFLYVLATSVVIAFGAICFVLIYEPIPEGANQVVLLLFGGLVAGFTQVMNYFFGSSKGSKDKTNLMALKK